MNKTETYPLQPQWVTGAPPLKGEKPAIPMPVAPKASFTKKLRVYTPMQLQKIANDPQFYLFFTFLALTVVFSLALLIAGSAFGSAALAAGTLLIAPHLIKLTLITLISTGIFSSLAILSRPTFSRKEMFHWAAKNGQTENVRAMMDVGHMPTEKDIGQAWFYDRKDILQLFKDRTVPFGAYEEEVKKLLTTSSGPKDISMARFYTNEETLEMIKDYQSPFTYVVTTYPLSPIENGVSR